MNKEIWLRVKDHLEESLPYFDENQFVGIFLQGSQNYKLDLPQSDVDTKMIVLPSVDNLVFNDKPVSKTHVRENNEHTDWKDFRLYIETFRKQNINFIEILFTDYYILNEKYKEYWNVLINHREEIARMNPYRAIKAMKGMAYEKYYALEKPFEGKLEILKKYGYDGKQIHHLRRLEDFIKRYLDGESYEKCLIPSENIVEELIDWKQFRFSLEEARVAASTSIGNIEKMIEESRFEDKEDGNVLKLLHAVQSKILRESLKNELLEESR